jgi:hypothetical protein
MRDLENIGAEPRVPAEAEASPAVKRIFVEVQRRSTRDLAKCIKADLLNSLDPDLLERARREANAEPPESPPGS